MTSFLTRRRMLAGSATLAAGLAVTGCGPTTNEPGAPAPTGSSGAEGPILPKQVPFAGVTPDLPAGDGGVPQGFFGYPETPAVRPGYPLDGIAPVTALLQADKVMTPRGDNSWWQEIETDLGTTVEATTVASANYREKFQVTMAGGDIPDLCQIVTVAQLPKLLDKYFADLTDFVGGDAVAEYPGLASLPSDAWRLAVVKGRVRGIVQPRPSGGRVVSYRGDLFEKFGITEPPPLGSGEDFLALCREVTDPKRDLYAMGAMPASWALFIVLEAMGAPNVWSQDDGKFTHVYEAEQMKDALAIVKQMFDDKLLHPESVTNPAGNFGWWSAGTTSIYIQDFAGWPRYAREYPDWKLNALRMPAWDGAGASVKHLGNPGYGAFVAIKKGDDQRVADLLRVVDYVASPFGTQEYLDVNFGAKDKDYRLQDSDPVPTESAVANTPQGLLYAGGQGYTALYDPSNTDQVKAQHAYLTKVMPDGIRNAAQGLYSEAAVSSGTAAAIALVNVQTDIIVGRKNISEWDATVDGWRKAAGDEQRREYEEAFAMQAGG